MDHLEQQAQNLEHQVYQDGSRAVNYGENTAAYYADAGVDNLGHGTNWVGQELEYGGQRVGGPVGDAINWVGEEVADLGSDVRSSLNKTFNFNQMLVAIVLAAAVGYLVAKRQ